MNMSRKFRFYIITALGLGLSLTSCHDSNVYFGNKIVSEPKEEIIDMPLDYFIDACNGTVISYTNLDFDTSDTIRINGWALGPEKKSLSKLIIRAGGNYISANYGFYRADVQNAMQSDEKGYGYMFSFSRSLLLDKNNEPVKELGLIGITKDGKMLKPAHIKLGRETESVPDQTTPAAE